MDFATFIVKNTIIIELFLGNNIKKYYESINKEEQVKYNTIIRNVLINFPEKIPYIEKNYPIFISITNL